MRAIVVLSLLAFAPALVSAAAIQAGPVGGVTIDVPKTELTFNDSQDGANRSAQLEVQLASWAPSNYAPNAVNGAMPAYSRSLPYLSLARVLPIAQTRAGELSLKLGAGFLSLTRATNGANQDSYLLTARIGAELRRPLANGLVPYAGLALLPTSAITPRSVFGDGATDLGLAAELTAGVAVKSFFAGVMATAGSVNSSDLFGAGFAAGLHFGI